PNPLPMGEGVFKKLNRSSLEPPEFLVARLLAEGAALAQRVGLLLQQRHRLLVERAQAGDLGDDVVGEEARFERPAAGLLDLFRQQSEWLGAELARLGLHRMGGKDERGGVLAVGRLLDTSDGFLAVLAEIAEDAHEIRPEFGA